MARATFLARVTHDGATLDDYAKRAARARGEIFVPAEKLKVPPHFAHLLIWYLDLRMANGRGWRFEPLSFTEIAAYRDLFRLNMTGTDVEMLRRLDNIWQSVQPEPKK